jgi:hypothetical protein
MVRFPAGAGDFSLHHRNQIGSGAHSASYPMGTRGSFSGVKRPGREADHSPPSSAEVKNAYRYTFTPQYAFMAWCSFKVQGQLYLCIMHDIRCHDNTEWRCFDTVAIYIFEGRTQTAGLCEHDAEHNIWTKDREVTGSWTKTAKIKMRWTDHVARILERGERIQNFGCKTWRESNTWKT